MELERRYMSVSDMPEAFGLEERSDGRPMFRGLAAVFNSLSQDLGGFREVLLPGAFDAALARRQDGPGRPSAASRRSGDVIAVWNHDPSQLLGRTSSGTLRLSADDVGLRFEIDPPDTQLARDLTSLVRRSDVFGASFAFTVDPADETYEQTDGGAIRTIRNVSGLYDVSLVTNPAYMGTAASVRSYEAWRASTVAPEPEIVAPEESIEQLREAWRSVRARAVVARANAELARMRAR
jgi:HK97 family phage prohead protease